MNRTLVNNTRPRDNMAKPFFCSQRLAWITLLALVGFLLLLTPVQSGQSSIKIVDTWVEDGFIFHVVFKAKPANAQCDLDGEGLIEFEVVFDAGSSSEAQSTFGIAKWYPSSNADDWIETQGEAIGSQGICTTFSPCGIQQINIVKGWCPVTNDPLYP